MRGKESSLRPSPVWKSVFSELDMASESLLWGQVVYDHSFVGSRQIAGLIIFFFFLGTGPASVANQNTAVSADSSNPILRIHLRIPARDCVR